MTYDFHLVNAKDWYPALEPLFRMHYAEMQARLAGDGVSIGDYDPNLTDYFAAADAGTYQCAIVLENDTLIGYCTFWVTKDMHCQSELICQEDALYVVPEARRGAGRPLVRFVLDYLETLGVKRATITPVTDLRVGKIWRRMGFVPVAELMVYTFTQEAENLRANAA
jgi:GNAT superfamily N-acetyltransferase